MSTLNHFYADFDGDEYNEYPSAPFVFCRVATPAETDAMIALVSTQGFIMDGNIKDDTEDFNIMESID